MSSQQLLGDREKRSIRQTMRSGVKWLKDVSKRPSSPRLPPGSPASLPTPSESSNLSASRVTMPLLSSGLPTSIESESMIEASGSSTQVAVLDYEGENNLEVKEPENIIWSRLANSLRALETGVGLFPPLKSAIGAFRGCLDIVQQAAQNRADYGELANELQSMADMLKQFAGGLELEPSNGSIANIAQCMQHEVSDIERRQDGGADRRLRDATHDQENVIRCYRRVERLFRQLQTDLSMRTKKEVKEMNERALLQCIAPIDDARYNSSYSDTIRRRGCTAQTREAIHGALQNWTTNPHSERIYWMNGMAGTGKTTITYSYCEWLESTNRLGASFFCSRISSTCRSLSQIVPTVASQLARFSPAFRSRLCAVLNNDPVAGKLNVGQQFEKLIYQPLLESKDAIPDGVVIVIDALDECDDNYSVRLLLDVLLKFAEQLPLKFFVASRPEAVIRDRMISQGGSSRFIVYLHDIEHSIVEEDIKKYLTEAFTPMESPPSQAQVELLAKRSRNLFIYAATVVRYIYPDDISVDSTDRLVLMLNAVTSSTPGATSDDRYNDLDLLYTTVLSAVFESRLGHHEKDRMRRVLWTIVCAREPIPVATIAFLAGMTERQVLSALQWLRSVVHVPENSSLISPLHASFPEYMLAEPRSKNFHCIEFKSNEVLAHRCFEAMESELRFNICALESSYLTDDQIPDLEARVARCISPTLSYACQYWSSHLRQSPPIENTGDMLLDFLSNRLLFWMEVLSLSRCIGMGASMMQQAQTWLQKTGNKQDDTQKRVSDARNFITWFAANPCSRSTPHIYISALPLCARSSWVYHHYSQRIQGLACVLASKHDESMLAIWNVAYLIFSLAISPNGNSVATGGSHGSVQVYNIHTGALIAGPFQGHTDQVYSVAFCPNGVHIATSSYDKTIIVWDALTGRVVTGPLRKHTRSVNSVAFAPDGIRLVSGSSDKTIIVWDISTGDIALGPLHGHTGAIWSVCFSPTNQLVASCSDDLSIRLWDAQTGADVAILGGHKRPIKTATFSPDANRLASCSLDGTIQLWDIATRTIIRQPLIAHIPGIKSIDFSSDNEHIVSGGSEDGSIIVWNTFTGLPVLGPFSGHSTRVERVVFSPDNTRVVSCSTDQTMRLWDVEIKSKAIKSCSREVSVGPVAFLPNRTHFISNSSIGVPRLWDIRTGKSTPLTLEIQEQLGDIQSLTVSSRGIYAAVGINDGTIQVWDVLTGNGACRPLGGRLGMIHSLSFSFDDTHLCSGLSDATIIIWNIEMGVMVGQPYRGHTGAVLSVIYSPDGTRIASGAIDRTVRIWDSATELLVHTLNGHKDSVSSLAFSSDGNNVVSASLDGAICTWDGETGNCLSILFEPDDLPVPVPVPHSQSYTAAHCISFSPNGDRLVSGCGPSIVVVDVRTMELISELDLPQSEQIIWIGYSLDGTDIISVSVPEEAPAQEAGDEYNPQRLNIIRVWRADPSPNHGQPAPNSTPHRWSYERDGRILSPEGFVMWIPPDLVPHLEAHMKLGSPSFSVPIVLSPNCFINLGDSDLFIGERWTKCYT